MLRFESSLHNLSLMSLRIGYPVGSTTDPIINPHNLTILGFFVLAQDVPPPAVILSQSIREASGRRLIIDSEDEIMPAGDLIRDKEIVELNYQLIGKKVITESKRTLGKVEDYVANDKGFVIYKVHVAPTGMRSITNSKLIIDRTQIVATDDKFIVVKDGFEKSAAPATSLAVTAG